MTLTERGHRWHMLVLSEQQKETSPLISALTKEVERLSAIRALMADANEDSIAEIERLENEIKAAIPLNQERLHEMNRLRARNQQLFDSLYFDEKRIVRLEAELKLANAVVKALDYIVNHMTIDRAYGESLVFKEAREALAALKGTDNSA